MCLALIRYYDGNLCIVWLKDDDQLSLKQFLSYCALSNIMQPFMDMYGDL